MHVVLRRRRALAPELGGATVLLSAVLALAGAALLAVMLAQPRLRTAAAGEVVAAGGLSMSVAEAGWVTHDHSSMGQMPMANMPAQDASRLHIRVLLDNAGTDAASVRAGDFRLVSPSGESWTPQRATVPATRLAAGQSLVGDLYFEVPDGRSDFHLSLSQGRDRAFVALALPGSTSHAHRERNSQ